MNVVSKVEAAVGRVSVAWLSFAVRYPVAYLMTVAFIGVLFLIVFFAPEASAQLETEVTTALNPLARLLVGPIAKGLAVIELFAFVACSTQVAGWVLCRLWSRLSFSGSLPSLSP
jgi:type IV secretory pathway VirB2 component (pilin)